MIVVNIDLNLSWRPKRVMLLDKYFLGITSGQEAFWKQTKLIQEIRSNTMTIGLVSWNRTRFENKSRYYTYINEELSQLNKAIRVETSHNQISQDFVKTRWNIIFGICLERKKEYCRKCKSCILGFVPSEFRKVRVDKSRRSPYK